MKNFIGVAVLFQLFFAVGMASAANLVSNGDFSGGTYAGDVADNTQGDVIPDGWILESPDPIGSSNFQIENTAQTGVNEPPQIGSYYAGFFSTADPFTAGQDCLLQFIQTTAGQEYAVSFWVAITGPASGGTFLDPVWGFNQPNQTDMINSFYYNPSNTGPVGFEEFSFTELATSSTTNLIFHGTGGGVGVLLADVSVTANQDAATPEPSSFLLGAMGVLGGVLLLKRRTSSIRLW